MNPQQMQALYSQMAQRAIAPQMARMQPPPAPTPPAPQRPAAVTQRPMAVGRGTRGPAITPADVAAQRDEERRRAAAKAAQRQRDLSRPRTYVSGPAETQQQFDQRMGDLAAAAGNWLSMNTATGQLETNIKPFGYTDQSGRYIGPYRQGYGNYVAPMLEPQSINATPYTT